MRPASATARSLRRCESSGIKHQDEATEFKALELRVSREVQPYSHQTEALAAWKQAGRQGVVVLAHRGGQDLRGPAGHARHAHAAR